MGGNHGQEYPEETHTGGGFLWVSPRQEGRAEHLILQFFVFTVSDLLIQEKYSLGGGNSLFCVHEIFINACYFTASGHTAMHSCLFTYSPQDMNKHTHAYMSGKATGMKPTVSYFQMGTVKRRQQLSQTELFPF